MSDLTDVFPPLEALPHHDPDVRRLHGLFIEHMFAARQAGLATASAANAREVHHRTPTESGVSHARAKATETRLNDERLAAVAQARATCADLVDAIRRHVPPGPRPKLDAWLAAAENWATGGDS